MQLCSVCEPTEDRPSSVQLGACARKGGKRVEGGVVFLLAIVACEQSRKVCGSTAGKCVAKCGQWFWCFSWWFELKLACPWLGVRGWVACCVLRVGGAFPLLARRRSQRISRCRMRPVKPELPNLCMRANVKKRARLIRGRLKLSLQRTLNGPMTHRHAAAILLLR